MLQCLMLSLNLPIARMAPGYACQVSCNPKRLAVMFPFLLLVKFAFGGAK